MYSTWPNYRFLVSRSISLVHCLKKVGLDYLNLTDEEKNEVFRIPVDFNKNESIMKKVGEHPEFQNGVKTVIIMEGVSQYIPNELTAKTLTRVHSIFGKRIYPRNESCEQSSIPMIRKK